MDRKKVYKIIPVEFENILDGAYVLTSPDGEQYKLTGGNFPTKRGNLIRLDKNTFLRLMNDITVEDDLEEIVILNDDEDSTHISQYGNFNLSNTKEKEHAMWPEEATKILVEMYKTYKPLVENTEIKTMKQMWDIISNNLREKGYIYEPHQVVNKWKGLVRRYRTAHQGGPKPKPSHLIGTLEKEVGEILLRSQINLSEKYTDEKHVPAGPSDKKKIKLNSEEIISNEKNLNIEGINYNLCQIVRAIESGTIKREKAEERKLEQRERLIKAIEKGNELLCKLLQQK